MQFVELPSFTRRAAELLSDDEYRALQSLLTNSPTAGRLIVGTGGAHKVRWSREGSGKSGGVRVIYYHAVSRQIILMLSIYSKSEQDSLPDVQKHLLRKAIERYLG
jgi:mRNA-degrading endonuclease RelE of RelBE toxin-antitoxin system